MNSAAGKHTITFTCQRGPATVWREPARGKTLVSFQPNIYKRKSVCLANHSLVSVGREVKALFVIL